MMDNMTQLISWFQLEYPELVSDMKNSNHHYIGESGEAIKIEVEFEGYEDLSLNPYHLESDVFTHTMMVCKQAENAPYLVKLAALLHDIGKPATRKVNPKNGRVSFFNHDAVGAFMAIEILKRPELGLTKGQISHVFNLIALHTQIYKLSHEQLYNIGDMAVVSDLIELGKADHSGRFHTEGDAEIPTIDDIRPISGVSSTARGSFDKEKEVIVLCGLPASGKSTWVSKNTDIEYIVSRDNCLMYEARAVIGFDFMYSEAWEKVDQNKVSNRLEVQFKESSSDEDFVVIDMTHMSKKSRRKSLSHFDSSYKKKCIVFLTDLETLHLRNSQRTGKVIDKEVIEKMMRSFYPPTLEEFDEIEYVIGD